MCGDPDPGVHHREPGKSLLHLMIALCAGCHAKVHRTKVVLTEFPPLLLVLWREQHPEGHEQTYIDFKGSQTAGSECATELCRQRRLSYRHWDVGSTITLKIEAVQLDP